MTVSLSPLAVQKFFDNAGAPLAGGLLYSYAAGTSTPQATYTDSSQSTANTNPVVMNSRGECNLWLDSSLTYKLVLQTSGGVTIWSVDNIVAGGGGGGGGGTVLASNVLFDDTTSAGMFTNRLARVVTSIANLRAVPKTLYSYALATGYYASGDGGGGQYYYDSTDTTSADNGGTIIVANDTGRWKLAQNHIVSFKQFGCKCDGTTDDSTQAQAALNAGLRNLYLPSSTNGLRTTTQLNITAGITITGDGTSPYGTTGPFSTRQPGSWFLFDHAGIGIKASNAAGANFLSTVKFTGIGSYRKHANAIGPGWTPTVFGFDFVCDNCDMVMDDVMPFNAYSAVNITNGNAGRFTGTNVRGQWFFVGINVDKALDTVRLDKIHMWPFWSNDSNVTSWQQANSNFIALNRCDNPEFSNLFSIFTANALSIYQNASGTASKIHVVNMDNDFTLNGIYVDASVTGAKGQFVNVTNYGPTAATSGAYNIRVTGTNCRFDFVNLEGENLSRGLIRVEGTGNTVRVTSPRVNTWDRLAVSAPIMDVLAGNTLYITDRIVSDGSGTVVLNAGGTIKYPQYITSGNATITSVATTVVVTHGLPATPLNTQVQITPLVSWGSATKFWLTSVGATTFTITVDIAPGSNLTFAWRATLE